MRSLFYAAIASIWLVSSAANSLRADLITAEYVPLVFDSGSTVSGFNDGTTFMPAQVFTATVAGNLSKISVGVWSTSATELLVELRSTSGGLPTSTVLATQSINPGIAFADQTLHTADFSTSGISLVANTQYAISLRTVNNAVNVAWSGDFTNPYAGGDFAVSSNNGTSWLQQSLPEAVFRVTVTAVPEPASCCLVCMGIGLIVMKRNRRV